MAIKFADISGDREMLNRKKTDETQKEKETAVKVVEREAAPHLIGLLKFVF